MGGADLFAVVEIMGHRTRAGRLSDAQLGGATMLRIEHPSAIGHNGDPLVEYYAPTAIFAIRPCTQAEAEQTAGWSWRVPSLETAGRPQLAPPFEDLIDHDDAFDAEIVGDDEEED